MKILKNIIKNDLNIRTEIDYPIKGIEFIDINPLLMQKNTFHEIIDLFSNELRDKKIDYIIVPEARGFLLGSAVAYNLGTGCIPVRKKGKLPPTTITKSISYEKEYGKDFLELPKLVSGDYGNKKFYIIDDIYATGNTINAISDAIEEMGGNVVGKGVILNIVELNECKDLFSLIDVNEE